MKQWKQHSEREERTNDIFKDESETETEKEEGENKRGRFSYRDIDLNTEESPSFTNERTASRSSGSTRRSALLTTTTTFFFHLSIMDKNLRSEALNGLSTLVTNKTASDSGMKVSVITISE